MSTEPFGNQETGGDNKKLEPLSVVPVGTLVQAVSGAEKGEVEGNILLHPWSQHVGPYVTSDFFIF